MRRPRNLIQGAEYHVIARANRQEFILHSDQMKDLFLKVVSEAKKKHRFRIRNFTIMSNHFHMIIHPLGDENLSRIMQWILSVFAQRYNKLFGYIGHVWWDRFKSYVLHNIRQFVHTFRYIAENPVKAGISTDAFTYRYNGVNRIRAGDFSIVDPPEKVITEWLPEYFPMQIAGLARK